MIMYIVDIVICADVECDKVVRWILCDLDVSVDLTGGGGFISPLWKGGSSSYGKGLSPFT